jgi:demethylmacrocin O-methyltransferase
MELNSIMVKYGTDKQKELHNYVQFYEKYFNEYKDKNIKILEIGIYRPPLDGRAQVGASLKTWYDYFPNAQIIGADIDDFSDVDNDRITTIKINQESRDMNDGNIGSLQTIIERFGDDFDIIIDDGGHTMLQQQVTLGYMFKFLKPGGLFVIEDLHTSYFAPFAYNKTNTTHTTLLMLENYVRDKKIISDFISDEEKFYLHNHINNMVIEKGNNSEIVFISKK